MEVDSRRFLRWLNIAAATIVAVLCGLHFFIPYSTTLPIPFFGDAFYHWYWVVRVSAVMALLIIMGSFLASMKPFYRTTARSLLIWSSLYIFLMIITSGAGYTARLYGFHRIARNSAPLVAAINAYNQQHGQPPQNLSDLVPNYLAKVPDTGMGAYPEYLYDRYNANQMGDPWQLLILTPFNDRAGNYFLYLPEQNYMEALNGTYYKKIDDWVYFFRR
jgi:hypothetical protein